MTWEDILKSDEQVLRNFLAETAKKYEGKRYNVVPLNPRFMEAEGNMQIYDAFKRLFEEDRNKVTNMAREYFGREAYAAPDYQGEQGVYYISV